MPLVRLQVRNVYGLRETELHRNVDREDPKANLDGVVATGLVGILRQIGDLAEFAAEIFHGIQEEVMITASRSNNLKMRLKQIEVTVPSIHKTVLAQTNHIQFAYTGGLEWHPRIPNVQNHFIHDDLPQFIMGPYEVCRDPPRLHLLDKFDINGAGSCLKRYSNPTHFKRPSKLPEIEKKKCVPQSRDISRITSMVNQSDRKTFSSLSLGGRTSSTNGIESRSDLQDLGACFLDSTSGAEKPKGLFSSSRFTRTIASVLSESESESEDANVSPSQDQTVVCATYEASQVMETGFVLDTLDDDKTTNGSEAEREAVEDVKTREIEMESEGDDDFVDALYTIDSESQTDQEVHAPSKPYSTETNTNNLTDDETECDTSNGAHNYSNGFSNPLYGDIIQKHQESEDETCCDSKIWSNENLVGSKPENVAGEEKAPFDWFTWSPQLDHMKISFNPLETLPTSELKQKLATDSDKDTSSSYSDNQSEQLWEEEESGERKNQQDRINGETSNGYGNVSYLQNPAEPLPPTLPPLQWMVSNNKLKNSSSTINKEIPNFVIASDPKPVNDVVHLKNNVREFSQSHGNEKQMEAGDFLHQIRTKQYNLRRVVTARTSSSEATTNANIGRILEKVNSIRQAVASDEGDSESNTWSDSDG